MSTSEPSDRVCASVLEQLEPRLLLEASPGPVLLEPTTELPQTQQVVVAKTDLFSTGLADASVQQVAYGISNEDNVLHLGDLGYAYRSDATASDLDYSKSFSIEGIVSIPPCAVAPDGAWGGIVTKGGTRVLYDVAAPGWGMGIYGSAPSLGQSIYVKVGDGSRQIVLESGEYAGLTYAVMTWDASAKILTLYVNGQLSISGTDTNIVLGGIDTTQSLQVGMSLNALGRDVVMGRMWNRLLSSGEVSTLWNSFNSTARHTLPTGFNATDLKSQWLMDATSNSSGGSGTTHVKDSVGANHLQLADGAQIALATGALVLQWPSAGATNMDSSVTLTVSGGRGNFVSVTGPMSYYFQVDTSSSFNSSNLEESGWLSHIGAWKPVLQPGTTYYWRAKVRDASTTPQESGYASVRSFTTETAETWYVRPSGGSYGSENGTSYANAWDGLKSIVFGPGGVEAGDTLYVCGTHEYTMTSGGALTEQALVRISESGYSDQYPITIRMDYAGDTGYVWGAFKDQRGGEDVWINYGGGIYYCDNIQYLQDGLFEDTAGPEEKDLQKMTSIASLVPGSYYDDGTGRVYVMLTDSSNPTGKIFESGQLGYRFDLDRANYIQFVNCNFRASTQEQDNKTTVVPAAPLASHITWDGCSVKYGYQAFISPTYGNDYWTIRNCDLQWGGAGVYSVTTSLGDGTSAGADYLTVEYSYIAHMGRFQHYNGDAHAIGIQGGHNDLIQYNVMEDCGSAVTLYNYTNMEMKNHVIRYNFAYDMNNRNGSGGGARGFEINGNSDTYWGLSTGNMLYYNIVLKAGSTGLRETRKDPVMFYNNTVYDVSLGMLAGGAGNQQYNQIIAYVSDKGGGWPVEHSDHFVYLGWDGTDCFDNDYNSYYPGATSGTRFKDMIGSYHEYNFSGWRAAHPFLDAHSFTSNPYFVSSTPTQATDLQLAWNSPLIDAGYAVAGIPTVDFAGNPWYGAPDIGAWEYQPPYSMGVDVLKTGAKARIYGDGKYRWLASASTTADLIVAPAGGYGTYGPTQQRPLWMDIIVDSWSTSGNYYRKWRADNAALSSATSSVHTVGGLAANRSYCIWVDGVVGQGLSGGASYTSDAQGRITFTYTGEYTDTVFELKMVPSAPSNLNAAAVSMSRINLTWTDNSSDETGFKIERAPDAGGSPGTWQQITTVGANVTGHQDANLSAGTRYYYRVRAYNANGDSPYSDTSDSRTLVPGDTNGDGLVDMTDYSAWFNNYGKTGVTLADGDMNGDGTMDMGDYALWFNNYGLGGSASGDYRVDASVPMPIATTHATAPAAAATAYRSAPVTSSTYPAVQLLWGQPGAPLPYSPAQSAKDKVDSLGIFNPLPAVNESRPVQPRRWLGITDRLPAMPAWSGELVDLLSPADLLSSRM